MNAGRADSLEQIILLGLWQSGSPLRLHLGCGETRIADYINIDFPSDSHNVMVTAPDFIADVVGLHFPSGSVDEIRLHHVFEHFNRVVALGLLIRWHEWLRPGGLLVIETPDFMATSAAAQSAAFDQQMALVRHLEGDQAAHWAFHIGQWFPARFERTLKALGFEILEMKKTASAWHNPPLHNVTVTAKKIAEVPRQELHSVANSLLKLSLVAAEEQPTLDVWKAQLSRFLQHGILPHDNARRVDQDSDSGNQAVSRLINAMQQLSSTNPDIHSIHDFNKQQRDRWVRDQLAGIPAGSRVLDVGAGPCFYRDDLRHTIYETHDFKQYHGYTDPARAEGLYGQIDHVSDILDLPFDNEVFDYILCTEVLEHVPEPIGAIREMARVLKYSGRMILTAPLGSGLHQEPFHFYGGYTPHWYQMVAERFGLQVQQVQANRGFYSHLAQECARVAWTLAQHRDAFGDDADAIGVLFGELLPRYLYGKDDAVKMEQFTVGYFVILEKRPR